jgi:hypothetical protein
MNRLLYPNGGREIFGDDLVWENEVLRSTIAGIMSMFCPNPARSYILSGLSVVFRNEYGGIQYSDGYIFHKGEVFYCETEPFHMNNYTGEDWIRIIAEKVEVRTLRNGQTVPTRELRHAKMLSDISDDAGYDIVFSEMVRVKFG